MMPADLNGGERLPDLCPDHVPVIRAAGRWAHVGESDQRDAHIERARQCPDCRALRADA